jgi:hypothetical protein
MSPKSYSFLTLAYLSEITLGTDFTVNVPFVNLGTCCHSIDLFDHSMGRLWNGIKLLALNSPWYDLGFYWSDDLCYHHQHCGVRDGDAGNIFNQTAT